MNEEDDIHDSLALFHATNDLDHWRNFLLGFLAKYGALVDVECHHVNNGWPSLTGPGLASLSDNLLDVVLQRLEECEKEFHQKWDTSDGYAAMTDFSKILIIVCRKYENIALVASCEYLRYMVPLVEYAIKQICSSDEALRTNSAAFITHVCYFVECMYDPCHLWRRQNKNLPPSKEHLRQRQAMLSQEVVPFFYACMQESSWVSRSRANLHTTVVNMLGDVMVGSKEIAMLMCNHPSHGQMANLHTTVVNMLGAVMVGSKENAMLMCNPPVADSVFAALSSPVPDGVEVEGYSAAKHMLLRCLSHIIKICHISRQDQRQVSLNDLLKRLLMILGDSVSDPKLQAVILRTISSTLVLETIHGLQLEYLNAGLCRTLVQVLQKNVDNIDRQPDIPHRTVRVLSAIVLGNSKAKAIFKGQVGYQGYGRLLKRQGPPSDNTISALLDMVVESEFSLDKPAFVLNTGPIIVLLKLLPLVENQAMKQYIVDSIRHISVCYEYNRMLCCSEGVIGVLLDCLDKRDKLTDEVQEKIIKLIENLGSYSIIASQVKHLIGLMRGPDDDSLSPLCSRLMHALSTIARKETRRGAYHYFDFQEDNTGIHIPAIKRWPGSSFTFHTWICLNKTPLSAKTLSKGRYRRQLYSFYTSSGAGFEAFFTMEGVLVVGVSYKKEFSSTAMTESPVLDSGWHSITITHVSSRRMFGQRQVQVFVDGNLRHTAQLKFPSTTEPFVSCSISCPRDEDRIEDDIDEYHPTKSVNLPVSLSLPSRLGLSARGPKKQTEALASTTISVDMKDMEWGIPGSLQGQMGSACVFSDSVYPIQVKKLHAAGPNERCNFQSEDTDLVDLRGKLLLYYHANACHQNWCADLSQGVYKGQLCGTFCGAYDLKDVINCIGGIQVLFPILELVTLESNQDCETSEDELDSPDSVGEFLDWEVLPSSGGREKEERNKVAGFLTLLKNICVGHNINQELLHTTQGIPTVAALLQKVNPSLIDVKVLMAVQMFLESVCISSETLMKSAYRYLLFDFRLWSRSDFTVRIGHIQFLATIIKDNAKTLRKMYGVQYLLDIIRTYYSTTPNPSCSSTLPEEDAKIIRHSLFGLIKFYLKGITNTEMKAMIAFVLSVQDETLVCDGLDLLLYLLEYRGKDKTQSYLLLLEEGRAEFLYTLVVDKQYSIQVLIRIFKILSYLNRSKLNSRHKEQIQLAKVGYGGLTLQMSEDQIDMPIAQYLMEFVAEGTTNHLGLLSVLQLLPTRSCPLKLQVCTTVLDLFYQTPTCPARIGALPGWPLVFVQLAVQTSMSESPVRRSLSGMQYSDTFQKFQLSNSVSNSGDVEESDDTQSVSVGTPRDEDSVSKASSDVFEELPEVVDARSLNGMESPGKDAQPHNGMAALLEGNVPSERTSQMFVDTLVNVLVQLMWTGVQGTDEQAWIARAEVFAALTEVAASNELFEPASKLKWILLEKLLDSAASQVNESTRTAGLQENCIWLMRLVYYFIFEESEVDSGSAIHDDIHVELVLRIFDLLDALQVWEVSEGMEEWKEMSHIGLRLVLVFAGYNNIEICSLASAKLHCLLKTRKKSSLDNEAFFLLGSLDSAMVNTFTDAHDTYAHLVPILRAMVEMFREELLMDRHLPNMPSSSIQLFEDIETYLQSEEWRLYIDTQVKAFMEGYINEHYSVIHRMMVKFMDKCVHSYNTNNHLREKERGESKLRFQSLILEPAQEVLKSDIARQENFVSQLTNQRLSTLRQWRASKRFLIGERGAWAEKHPKLIHWKLSPQENFSRMRLKLTQNYNFNDHRDAAIGGPSVAPRPEEPELPSVGQEAIVTELQNGEDEDWVESSVEDPPATTREKMVISEECELITLVDVIQGRLEVTSTHVYFYDSNTDHDEGSGQDFKWSLSHLREVHLRRYNLRKSAIEIFFINQTNYFINFKDSKVRDKTYQSMLSLRPPNLYYFSTKSPAKLLRASGLTGKWVNREISNFEYLMQLNTIAGRTYNDLSQYPVFPWILCDYHSDVLDLSDPSIFRDLSKPIGVLNPDHVEQVKNRFESFEDPYGETPKFHYGTHYSNPAGVMHYLVRLEPFTTLHISLQGGKFDYADRQFHSLPSSFNNLMEGPNDVKELIPEFFYLPEFLVNDDNFDLGMLQGQTDRVDNVILPKWARSPEDFIYKHRQALESEYVSAHLHEWIDLIFGYKQKGEEAVNAFNVFYYTTYEGVIDLDQIADEADRQRYEEMINNFGQTPCQLLRTPHPKRMAASEKKRGVQFDNIFNFLGRGGLKAFFVEVAPAATAEVLVYVRVPKSQTKFPFYQGMHDTLVTVSEQGVVGCHSWLPYDRSISNYFTFDRDSTLFSSKTRKCVGGPFAPGIKVTSSLFVVTHDAKLLFTGGHWDGSLRVVTTRGKMIAHMARHQDVVTCLALDNCGMYLITGSRDTTCMIWEVTYQNGVSSGISNRPTQTLYGHDDEVTSVALSSEFDMAVSGSRDGTVIVHTLLKGHYIRTLKPPNEKGEEITIPLLAISDEGHIIIHCRHLGKKANEESGSLHVYSINGKYQCSDLTVGQITGMEVINEYLITGNDQGVLTIRNVFGLEVCTALPLEVPIHSISVVPTKSHILVGLRDGKLIIVGVNKSAEIKKFLSIVTNR